MHILLDLLNYNDGELCLSAAQLLFEMHYKKSAILSAAVYLGEVLPTCMADKDKVLHEMLRSSPRS